MIPIVHIPTDYEDMAALADGGVIDRGLLAHMAEEGIVEVDVLNTLHLGAMLYLSPQTTDLSDRHQSFGHLFTPKSGTPTPTCGRYWAADCDILGGRFTWDGYYQWLTAMLPHQHTNLFAVCPDVVERTPDGYARGDAKATRKQFDEYAWRIRDLAYPVAYVAQDGQEDLPWPDPSEWSVLFVGGSTTWKLGAGAAACIAHAKRLKKWVHVGRVNSAMRLSLFQQLHADSADGTTITRAPDDGYRIIGGQLAQLPMR